MCIPEKVKICSKSKAPKDALPRVLIGTLADLLLKEFLNQAEVAVRQDWLEVRLLDWLELLQLGPLLLLLFVLVCSLLTRCWSWVAMGGVGERDEIGLRLPSLCVLISFLLLSIFRSH